MRGAAVMLASGGEPATMVADVFCGYDLARMEVAMGRVRDDEVVQALLGSPWERGLRAMESGTHLKVCAWCLMHPALPGSDHCSEFCSMAHEVMAVFEEEEGVGP